MRAAIYVDNGRVFLVRVEAHRLNQAIIQVGLSVGGFDGADADFGQVVLFFHRVGGSKQCNAFFPVGRQDADFTWNIVRSEIVYQECSVFRELRAVHSVPFAYQGTFPGLYIEAEDIGLERRDFRASDDDGLHLLVKA